jgi:uncharacterized membrane protein YfcA
VGSVAGAAVGSWLMHWKLDARQVKSIIGIVLYAFALKMFWGHSETLSSKITRGEYLG